MKKQSSRRTPTCPRLSFSNHWRSSVVGTYYAFNVDSGFIGKSMSNLNGICATTIEVWRFVHFQPYSWQNDGRSIKGMSNGKGQLYRDPNDE